MIDPSAFTIPYDRHLCCALSRARHDVILFTRPARQQDYFKSARNSAEGPDDASFVTDERVYRSYFQSSSNPTFRRFQLAAKAAEHIRNTRRLLARLKEFRPTAVHFQWIVIPSVDAHFVKQIRRFAPVFLTVHDAEAFHSPSSKLQMFGWATALAQFDGLIAHTNHTRECLESLGIPSARIKEVPHGVLRLSESALRGNSESESNRDSDCRLLFFGSIKQYKGLDVLLQALSLVPQSIRDRLRLKVAGRPDLPERDLRRLAADYGVERSVDWQLRFFGDDEIDDLFQQCDVVVFPYRRIDASGALMTAVPYRKAIIASQLGQFAELLENKKSALLVPPGDPQALANAIEEIASNHKLRSQLAAGVDDAARSVPSWDEIGNRTVDFYVECRAQRSVMFQVSG